MAKKYKNGDVMVELKPQTEDDFLACCRNEISSMYGYEDGFNVVDVVNGMIRIETDQPLNRLHLIKFHSLGLHIVRINSEQDGILQITLSF